METLQQIIQNVLNLGSAVFIPALMILIGLLVKMKSKDAISAGITLGVAFIGMNLVIGFMMSSLTPAAQALAERTGISLTVIDGGWTSMATLSWAWPYAFLMFPLQLLINGIMLAMNKTKTLNVDLWNVWGKIFTAVLIVGVTNNLYLAFIGAAITIVLELLFSDINQPEIERLTGIPGVTVSHGMMMLGALLMPFDLLLRKIPAFNKEMDATMLKEKIGMFGENHVMGFIIGFFLALAGGYSVGAALMLGMQSATAMTLFPMVSKLFMQALSPISEAMSDFMKNRFKDREMFIGLDWPILAGSSEVWVIMILMVPVTLLFAFILPGNAVLPFAGILNVGMVAPALVVTGGNLIRMFIISVIGTPIFLYSASYFANTITKLANDTGAVELAQGQRITWSTLEYPDIRFVLTELLQFKILGFVLAAVWVALFVLYSKVMKNRAANEPVVSADAEWDMEPNEV